MGVGKGVGPLGGGVGVDGDVVLPGGGARVGDGDVSTALSRVAATIDTTRAALESKQTKAMQTNNRPPRGRFCPYMFFFVCQSFVKNNAWF